ncbi:hypothetical protein F4811DRAFT_570235 [Daldinia bambusicola]|nr:hypothetical protein F4811DRAFT_570235 [Daldinia bambusicola]
MAAVASSADGDVELQTETFDIATKIQAETTHPRPSTSVTRTIWPYDAFWEVRLLTINNLRTSFNSTGTPPNYLRHVKFVLGDYPKAGQSTRLDFSDQKDRVGIYAKWPKTNLKLDDPRRPAYLVEYFPNPEYTLDKNTRKLLHPKNDRPIGPDDPLLGIVCYFRTDWIGANMANLSPECLAAFFCLFRSELESEPDAAEGNLLKSVPFSFLEEYSLSSYMSSPSYPCVRQGLSFSLRYHLRYYSCSLSSVHKTSSTLSGIRCNRDGGTLRLPENSLTITEESISAVFLTDLSRAGAFVVGIFHDEFIQRKETPKQLSRYDCEADGIITFQNITWSLLRDWHTKWIESLHKIDFFLANKVQDVIKPHLRKRLMYDDDKLQRSELYFSLLQSLRIFSTGIKSNAKQLKGMVGESRKEYGDAIAGFKDAERGASVVNEKWEPIVRSLEVIETDLVGRVDRQIEDVKSLRDGTFYGMHIYDAAPPDDPDSDAKNQQRFWAITAGVALITYALGAIGLTSFKWRDHWQGSRFRRKFVPGGIGMTVRRWYDECKWVATGKRAWGDEEGGVRTG